MVVLLGHYYTDPKALDESLDSAELGLIVDLVLSGALEQRLMKLLNNVDHL